MKGNSLIIIPTYNESENIELIISKILLLNDSNDILIVDDNSPDGTSNIVSDLKKENIDRIFLIVRDTKLGLGSAYKEGFKWALNKNYSYIFEMDADLSHNPSEIINLKELLIKRDFDVAIGSRYLEGVSVVNWPLSRIFLSYFANIYVRIITGMPVKDATSGFIGYTNESLSSLNIDNIKFNGYAFQIEMKFKLWKKNFKLMEHQIIFVNRKSGKSKMDKNIIFEAIFGVIRLKLNSLFKIDE
ncbi:polyprenol monophosphomannose synthase [Flavobacteriaceae bacterium]|jgi:dolichol-phosphate mannosyltransferase|nr:polyprenol monophosphomannose synthase [Flavobacteriaceae bacterium]MDA9850907.1 polyprenol monophosphomannose synthase [Flavobacteriaceae bacterium]MDB3874071.1 polyprenol monophosphomannose synthase [Flavobacteriaceae bacterium]MDB3963707.1 polyprenol monophosphomannose synthase [Flavobacteriaceae bacterium]MDC0559898.1 polyprenol monophosphomannose synthase [Flavobacteriaceae bacterium]|tara:strand:+ start:184 stop:915 length:732 start_codon:yes stop_codon:yes gene_type:complete